MRKEIVAFVVILMLAFLAAQYLPGILDMPAGVVQERTLLVLLPILLVFIWWTW